MGYTDPNNPLHPTDACRSCAWLDTDCEEGAELIQNTERFADVYKVYRGQFAAKKEKTDD